jgi:predicted Rossmann fold nucleotide-binding protein DprA/Smf involved in DNA uptake
MKTESRKAEESVVKDGGVPLPSVTVVNKQTMMINPDMQDLIKQSVLLHLKGNQELLKNVLKDFLNNHPHVLKEIVEELTNPPEVSFDSLDRETAKAKILEFIEANPGSRTSDIILATNLEPPLVMEILKELNTEGNIKKKSIE